MTEDKATAARPPWTHVKTPFGRTGIREKGVEVAVAASPQIAALIVTAVNGAGAVEEMRKALAEATRIENSNARRMRAAIVEARSRLAKGRALWNGPCHECDAVLEAALGAFNDPEHITAALSHVEG